MVSMGRNFHTRRRSTNRRGRLSAHPSFVPDCLTLIEVVISNPKTFLFAPLLRTKEKFLCELRL